MATMAPVPARSAVSSRNLWNISDLAVLVIFLSGIKAATVAGLQQEALGW